MSTTTTAKEHPILFSTPMVQAILEGRKTQTRRIIKPQPEHKQVHFHWRKLQYDGEHRMWCWNDLIMDNIVDFPHNEDRKALASRSPYGQVGDILWVRETWADCVLNWEPRVDGYDYKADDPDWASGHVKWRPSIFMPKDACRLFLEITNIRVERLQEISEEDAIAEGAPHDRYLGRGVIGGSHREGFIHLWESINGEQSWQSNPWVWVISFKQIPKP